MDGPGIPNLARKLDHLMSSVPQPDGRRPWTAEAVAAEVSKAGLSVTPTHIAHLRNGRRDNPSARLIASLAEVFGVPIAYFFDEDREQVVNDQLAAVAALRDAQVQGLMLRPGGGGIDAATVLGLIEAIRKVQTGDSDGPQPV